LIRYLNNFFNNNQSSGILLILCVLISLFTANSPLGDGFQSIIDLKLGAYTISTWVNDALMSIFFMLVGLEIKRELLYGELSNIKNASLPIFAAIGGMIAPACIYALFNIGTQYSQGWGIPMATDIAFSLAIISLLSKRVPTSLKVFLVALAIIDDLGAILVIAIFYTEKLNWSFLIASGGILLILALFNRMGLRKNIYYLILGVFLWYFMHNSGIHATISGVLLAFCIPSNKSDNINSPLEILEHYLHIPVNYLIMPIFALVNTNIVLHTKMISGLFTNLGLGIVLGLFLGKLIGICSFSFIAVKLGISKLPKDSKWSQMIGVGLLAGIGFTMSIFIAILSFKENQSVQDEAKFAILFASIISGFAGYLVLKLTSKISKA